MSPAAETDRDRLMKPDELEVSAREWALAMTAIPSVTGTADEATFSERLASKLRESPAFRDDPDAVWTVPVPGGRWSRACVLGLLRGEGARTVVLTGHFDTVETSCYGALEPLALDPERLGPALIAQIATEPFDERAARAREDLESGAFIAGRGLLDMKAGLAAGIAVAESLARHDRRQGNILFVAVPDEEGNSAGARRMAEVIGDIAARRGLNIVAAVNLDATGDEGDGTLGRMISLGSVGKLLPSALVVGRAQHVADTFRGFGAAALAGALAAEVEWLPELTERTGDELGAGPTLLGMKDSKTAYDVTMPASVWMYWNVALHRNGPRDVLGAMTRASERAASAHATSLASRSQTLGAGATIDDVAILSFDELHREVLARDAGAAAVVEALAAELASSDHDLPEQCRRLTEHIWMLSGRHGPAVVLGFASVPYLPATLGADENARRLEHAAKETSAWSAARFGAGFRTVRYFPGISDVSFFGQADAASIDAIAANTPAWRAVAGGSDRFAIAGIPTINMGPWGRDYHTRLERMHSDFGFRVFPAALAELTGRLLSAG
ncbi:MAG: M20/M25/M40 family metallo-hydrolase [Rhizobiaceae bacterium]